MDAQRIENQKIQEFENEIAWFLSKSIIEVQTSILNKSIIMLASHCLYSKAKSNKEWIGSIRVLALTLELLDGGVQALQQGALFSASVVFPYKLLDLKDTNGTSLVARFPGD